MIQYSVLYHDKRNDLMHKTIFYVPIKLTYIFNLENCFSQSYIKTDFWNVLKIVLKNKKNIDTQFYLYTPDFVFITNGLFSIYCSFFNISQSLILLFFIFFLHSLSPSFILLFIHFLSVSLSFSVQLKVRRSKSWMTWMNENKTSRPNYV